MTREEQQKLTDELANLVTKQLKDRSDVPAKYVGKIAEEVANCYWNSCCKHITIMK